MGAYDGQPDHPEIGRRRIDAWNSRDLGLVLTFCADDADLHFKAVGVYTSPNSLVVHYENQRGQKICASTMAARSYRLCQPPVTSNC